MSASAAAAAEAERGAGGTGPHAKCVLFLARFDPVNLSQLAVASDLALKTDASEVILVPFGSEYDSPGGAGSLARHALLHVAVNTGLAASVPVFAPPPNSWNCSSADVLDAAVSAAKARMAPTGVAFSLCAPEWLAGTKPSAVEAAGFVAALSRCEGRMVSLGSDGTIACKLESAPELAVVKRSPHGSCDCSACTPVIARGCDVAPLDISHEATALRIAALHRPPPPPSPSSAPRTDRQDAGRAPGAAAASGRRLAVSDALAGLVPVAVASACHRYGFYSGSPSGDARRHWAPLACDGAVCVSEGMVREAMSAGAAEASPAGASPKRRVAVLGGSFDPITRAHIMLAADGCVAEAVDEVWVVPCGPRPDKPGLSTHVAERLFDCVAAVEASLPASVPVFVVPFEVHVPIALSTFELLCTAHHVHGGCSFELMAGADLAASLPSWRHADQLMATARFLWVPRPGYRCGGAGDSLPSTDIAGRWLVPRDGMPRVAMRMSSTQVREAASKAAALKPNAVARLLGPMVADATAVRIARCGLYRSKYS